MFIGHFRCKIRLEYSFLNILPHLTPHLGRDCLSQKFHQLGKCLGRLRGKQIHRDPPLRILPAVDMGGQGPGFLPANVQDHLFKLLDVSLFFLPLLLQSQNRPHPQNRQHFTPCKVYLLIFEPVSGSFVQAKQFFCQSRHLLWEKLPGRIPDFFLIVLQKKCKLFPHHTPSPICIIPYIFLSMPLWDTANKFVVSHRSSVRH